MLAPFPILESAILPSPVRHLVTGSHGRELWLKDDSHIHPIYSGNKCRKLAHLLHLAGQKRETRVTTFGTAGSHHVLATGLLAQSSGFSVRAFLIPQPWSEHAEGVLRASVASDIELIAVDSVAHAVRAVARLRGSGMLIPPGGSNVCGSLGYFDAALELAAQVKRGEIPEPDWVVVPFGTGGTAAGLLAGIAAAGLKSKILAVSVVKGPGRTWATLWIAKRIVRGLEGGSRVNPSQIVVTTQWLGSGYGLEFPEGIEATARASKFDLPLDPSYTAKAFAGAWALLEGRKLSDCVAEKLLMPKAPEKILYWHTLSTPSQLQNGEVIIPSSLRSLLRPCPKC